jgi:hypothetical protein
LASTESVGPRNTHDGVAGGDHAPTAHCRLQHDAVLRRADVDAAQLILGGDLALDELADLVDGLAQVLGDLADHVLVDLDDLQFGLGDLALGLRARGDVLRALAGQAGQVALQRGEARDLDQAVELAPHSSFHTSAISFLSLLLRVTAISSPSCDALAQLRYHPARPNTRTSNSYLATHDVRTSGSSARS